MEAYSGNYTGPYWSDGKFQESVAFGEADPKSELDALARLHDTAYAVYKDRAHREAADEIFNTEAKKLVGKFPHLAGDLVLYGNYAHRQAKQLVSDTTALPFLGMPGALLGAVKFAGTNFINANKMINGTYLKKEKADVEALYARDPKRNTGPPADILKDTTPSKPVKPSAASPGNTLPGSEKLRPEVDRKLKSNSVLPSGPNESLLLPSKQAKRLMDYIRKRENANKPLQQHTKQKKKRLNLKKATKILPDYMLQ